VHLSVLDVGIGVLVGPVVHVVHTVSVRTILFPKVYEY